MKPGSLDSPVKESIGGCHADESILPNARVGDVLVLSGGEVDLVGVRITWGAIVGLRGVESRLVEVERRFCTRLLIAWNTGQASW